MRWSLRIGRILGIPIYLHFTFLIILPFFALVFGFAYSELFSFKIGFANLAVDDVGKVLLGTLAAVVFFASILIHELCHSYVALRNGYKISGITLLIFGGVSEIEQQPGEAKGEAWMAFVGPGSSLVIGVVVSALYFLTKDLSGGVELQAAVLMFSLIGFYNILLGLFNLLPAFPMDGGRVLRALLVKRLGFLKATRYAVDIGKAFAVGMGIFGLLTLNFILILIALFLFTGAEGEYQQTKVTSLLTGIKVGEIMTRQVSTVTPDETAHELLARMMREKHMGYPVMEGEQVVGMVTFQDVTMVPDEKRDVTRVRDIMSKNVIHVPPYMEAVDALKVFNDRSIGRLVVLVDGKLIGILSRTDMVRAMDMLAAGLRPTYEPVQRT
ncbi:MAG: CBS domain-containing protein [Methanomassiliicoccales archaeon]|jgi:Zn-dependent protease